MGDNWTTGAHWTTAGSATTFASGADPVANGADHAAITGADSTANGADHAATTGAADSTANGATGTDNAATTGTGNAATIGTGNAATIGTGNAATIGTGNAAHIPGTDSASTEAAKLEQHQRARDAGWPETTVNSAQVPGTDTPSTDATKLEQHQRARDAGWTETTAFDYDTFQRSGGNAGGWYGEARVYEWSGDYGDVGPEAPALEKVLFGSDLITREGQHRENIEIEVKLEGPTKVNKIASFDDAGLHPVIRDNVKRCGYNTPTPIQAYTLPAVHLGYDVVGIAQTGSGKTAAYMIPIISKLMGKAKKLCAPKPDVANGRPFDLRSHGVRAEPLVVVVVPTRELAIQIFDEARRMCYRSMLRPCVAYGGLPMGICCEELGKGCDVLIGTPGRLCALMDRPELLTMSRVKYTVIDEADEMLNTDWEAELSKIMGGGDTNEDADHVFMLFSATFPKDARELASNYMAQDYLRIRVGRPGQAHKNIRQNVVYVDQDNKREAVYDLLFASEPARTIIFCNSKLTVDLLDDFLYNRGMPTTSIHADRNQREREDAIRAFRTGRAPILIATGVSARGWDVKDLKHIINYDLPSQAYGGITEYVHRIGRTARIGNQGLATSFYNDRNEDLAQDLVNILVECDCEVPDFLSHLVPEEGGAIQFDDNSDDEAEGGGAAGDGDAWGGSADGDGGAPVADEGGFQAADNGFKAFDDGFKADGDAGASAW